MFINIFINFYQPVAYSDVSVQWSRTSKPKSLSLPKVLDVIHIFNRKFYHSRRINARKVSVIDWPSRYFPRARNCAKVIELAVLNRRLSRASVEINARSVHPTGKINRTGSDTVNWQANATWNDRDGGVPVSTIARLAAWRNRVRVRVVNRMNFAR